MPKGVYQRNPATIGKKSSTLLERLMLKIDTQGPNGCWIWKGAVNNKGYGRLRVGKRVIYSHRLIYSLLVEPFDDGLVINHVCKNRLCQNVAHMEIVASADNCRDAMRRKDNQSGWKGVIARKMKSGKIRYGAYLRSEGVRIWLGSFDSGEEASAAYEAKARELWGKFKNNGFETFKYLRNSGKKLL
jgi:hypothetical protein